MTMHFIARLNNLQSMVIRLFLQFLCRTRTDLVCESSEVGEEAWTRRLSVVLKKLADALSTKSNENYSHVIGCW